MGRGRWFAVAVAGLLAAAGVLAWRTWLQTPAGPFDPVSAVLAIAGLVVALAGLSLGLRSQRDADMDAAAAAGRLAVAVRDAESRAMRQLLGGHDRAIDVRFSFRPAPAHDAAGARQAGTLEEVAQYYLRLRPRRMVITGAAGSGKTVLAVELILALLEDRAADDPVPVRISATSLDAALPASTAVQEWLAAHLRQAYQLSWAAARHCWVGGMAYSFGAYSHGTVGSNRLITGGRGADEFTLHLWRPRRQQRTAAGRPRQVPRRALGTFTTLQDSTIVNVASPRPDLVTTSVGVPDSGSAPKRWPPSPGGVIASLLHELWPLAGPRLPRALISGLLAITWLGFAVWQFTHVPIGFAPRQVIGAASGMVAVAAALSLSWRPWPAPSLINLRQLRASPRRQRQLTAGLAVGLAVGLTFGLTAGLAFGLTFGLTAGLATGLTFGLTLGSCPGSRSMSTLSRSRGYRPVRPCGRLAVGSRSGRRDSRQYSVMQDSTVTALGCGRGSPAVRGGGTGAMRRCG